MEIAEIEDLKTVKGKDKMVKISILLFLVPQKLN